MEKTLITIHEAAAFTSLSVSYLHKLSSLGKIPCFKPTGKRLYFDKDDLDKWLRRNPIKSNESVKQKAATYIVNNATNNINSSK